MKKITIYLMAACLSLTFNPFAANAASAGIHSTATGYSDSTQAANLMIRLNEIRDMDKSVLNSSDKKALRKEVRAIKSEMKANSQGVYLSVGAIIIIILLLILIL
jgi:hypothetical protein